MSAAVKLVGVGAIIAGIVYLATRSSAIVKEFAFRIAGFGVPSLNDFTLHVPIIVEFNNFVGLPLNIDQLSGTVSIWIGDQWVPVASFSQPVTVQAGKQNIAVDTSIDLKTFAASNLATVAMAIMQTRKVFIRSEISAQYGPLNIPTEPFEKELHV